MTAYQDFEEKSVDKAVERACSDLGIKRDQLEYDIISHGSSGIFGLVGAKKAVIRVALPDSAVLPAEHDASGEKPVSPESQGQADSVSALVDEAFGSSQDDQGVENTKSSKSSVQAPRKTRKQKTKAAVQEDSHMPDDSADSELNKGFAEQPEAKSPADVQAAAEWVRGFLGQVLALISPDSELQVHAQEDLLRFDIQGGDSARLIGKRGQTLDAIYYLVEKGLYKQFGGGLTLEIDVEGYLEKRRTELTALATRLAQKAEQSGKPMVINRISAQDRRLVHLSLRDNRQVRTQSVGNGDLRKLLIMPKKKNHAKQSRAKSE